MDKLRRQLLNKRKLIEKKRSAHTKDLIETSSEFIIKTQLALLEEAFTSYTSTYEELSGLDEDDKQQGHMDELIEVSDTYVTLKADFLESLSNRTVDENKQTVQQNIRLPPINLPQFGGSFEEWYSFKDQFEAMVHKNKHINNTEKMYYLKTSLVGQAATVISSLSSDATNYIEAWKSVISRYDNKYLVFQIHMHHLFSQPAAQQESAIALKNLIDCTNKHVRALHALGRPTMYWDDVLVHLVSTKLPPEMRKTWEIESTSYSNFPTWHNLSEFIENRVHALEVMQFRHGSGKPKTTSKTVSHATVVRQQDHKQSCQVCSAPHSIYKCSMFMKASVEERRSLAQKLSICWNCLRPGHQKKQCTMDKVCKVCQAKHHTLLHLLESTVDDSDVNTPSVPSSTVETIAAHGTSRSLALSSVLLSTALVRVHGANGLSELCRALLDSASQSHFITHSLAARLGLERRSSTIVVGGISNAKTKVTEVTSFRISSRLTDIDYTLDALIAPCVTVDLPTTKLNVDQWSHIQNVALADPQFHTPGKIDLLIGAEFFMDIVQDGKIRGPIDGSPMLQNSTLGWIVCGGHFSQPNCHLSVKQSSSAPCYVVSCHSSTSLETTIKNFWELEEVPRLTVMSPDEQACEDHYVGTHARNADGRYVLRLPFKNPVVTNNSYWLALQRLKKVECFLSKNPNIAGQYRDFMLDYEQSHHMEKGVPAEHCVMRLPLQDHLEMDIKLLGVSYNATKDTFSIQTDATKAAQQLTKRQLLGEVARVYDPCGWLAPLVVVSKLILQMLWKEKVAWDEKVSGDLTSMWNAHRLSYTHLDTFDIPRYINLSSLPVISYTLHGFCDSSELAYAAVVYVSATADICTTTLLASKTRVAPLKKYQFLDSNCVVLSYSLNLSMSYEPYRWTTFVANRVTQIQQLVPDATWKHVRSGDNPADVASRGLTGDQLIKCDLWWHGPTWLPDQDSWPNSTPLLTTSTVPEERSVSTTAAPTVVTSDIITRYFDFDRLLRITSYLLRFMKNCRTSAENRVHGFISVPEMKQALQYWLRSAQELEFSAELNDLRQNTVLKSTSTLKSLNPFLDSAGLLRVGGRLSQSDLPYDHKHPIILPKTHHLTLLIVRREHILNLHSGLNVTMAVLRGRYWIIHGRSTIKRIIHQCVRCYRFRPLKSEQMMADLPPSRITVSKPFRQCGVDYAGPFTTRLPRGHTRVYTKSYLALFVCLVTKAVHLEVSNLQVDDLVVVKDDNTSPLQWTLARVIATHPSTHDSLVRVVTIRTADSTYKRPITKLLKLPLES
ncbi:unnamed protein product [Macrosiphum euphorbiae]|uniref:CCHC-type domain-containing protein n=1 Tax=Macrosiphum euphorbiae TaxID=13131 RepID=A0AAV0X4V8_9HEMI|nr:unnamed protein product [Macrosiphum euphorbiae]